MYSLLNGMCQSTGVISPNFESMHGGDSITPKITTPGIQVPVN